MRVDAVVRSLPGLVGPVPAELLGQVRLDNLRRLRLVSVMAGLVSAAHLVVFLLLEPADATQARWRAGVLIVHGMLVVGAVLIRLAVPRIESSADPTRGAAVISGAVLVAILAAGIALAVIDQLVTSSVTPVVVANAVAGLLLVLGPRVCLVVYPLGAAVFVLALPLTQTDPSVLTSNQVNGMTAGAVGLGLGLLRWRTEVNDHVLEERIRTQQEQLEQRNAELARIAAHDPLTGLLNRWQFELQFGQELARHRRSGEACSLLLCDIDHFKAVNDEHGHPAGDALLRELATLVTDRLRTSDVVARWGGEEFLVLLPRTDREGALVLAEQLREAVAAAGFEVGTGEAVGVTLSIGVAEVLTDHPQPLTEAYRRADTAMYRAKGSGRDRVEDAGLEPMPIPGDAGPDGQPPDTDDAG